MAMKRIEFRRNGKETPHRRDLPGDQQGACSKALESDVSPVPAVGLFRKLLWLADKPR